MCEDVTGDSGLLAYRDHLRHSGTYPLGIFAARSSEDKPRRDRRNACVLALELAGDESSLERGEDAAALGAELQRLDAKLNVTLELLGRVLEQQLQLPAPVRMRFNAYGVEWLGDDGAQPGETVIVAIHLPACPALPLELEARIAAPLEAGWTAAFFVALPESFVEAFERLVFRAHRREVALSAARE